MIQIPEPYVYVITQTDIEHHTDDDGQRSILSIHATAAQANKAAAAYLREELGCDEDEEEDFGGASVDESMRKGLYEATAEVYEDHRHALTIEVQKETLYGGKSLKSSSSHGGDNDGKKGPVKKRKAEGPPSGGNKKRREEVIVLD
jgi:hypothetical protein